MTSIYILVFVIEEKKEEVVKTDGTHRYHTFTTFCKEINLILNTADGCIKMKKEHKVD